MKLIFSTLMAGILVLAPAFAAPVALRRGSFPQVGGGSTVPTPGVPTPPKPDIPKPPVDVPAGVPQDPKVPNVPAVPAAGAKVASDVKEAAENAAKDAAGKKGEVTKPIVEGASPDIKGDGTSKPDAKEKKPQEATADAPAVPQDAPDAPAKLAALRESLTAVLALGKQADAALGKARSGQKIRAAIPVIRQVRKEISKLEPKDADQKEQEIKDRVTKFSDRLGELIGLGEGAMTVVRSAADGSDGFEKDVLKKCLDQLYVHVASTEIASYVEGNAYPGTFQGMFPKTARFKEQGARAFKTIFTDLDLPIPVRTLAGEGLSQIGSKADIEDISRVKADDLEERSIRENAELLMARLGERTEYDKKFAEADARIAESAKKQEAAQKKAKELTDKAEALKKKTDRTPEEEAALTAMQAEVQKAENDLISAIFQLGGAHNAKAQLHQNVWEYVETEKAFRSALSAWNRIASAIYGNERGRQTIQTTLYNLACCQSQQKRTDEALKSLDQAFFWGYSNFDWAKRDGDLASVRAHENFGKLIEEVKSGKAKDRWKKENEERQAGAEKSKDSESKPASGESKPAGDPKAPGSNEG